MSTVENDIEYAIKIITGEEHSRGIFTHHSKIYPFTNENQIGCFNNYDFNDKSCLTVLGSTDQALDMRLRGAKKITTFDINALTKYLLYLKLAALLSNITKEEYISFFYPYESFGCNKYVLNYNIFCKVVQNLSGDNLIFWSKLFDMFSPIIISTKLFTDAACSSKDLGNTIYYLNGDKYYELREKIKDLEIKFINSDIKNLPNKLTEKYDYIYLSNIMNQVMYIFGRDISKINSLAKYKKLTQKLSSFLNEDGVMVICYFFYCNFKTVEQVFNKNRFEYILFNERENNTDNKNAVLQYTKRTTLK